MLETIQEFIFSNSEYAPYIIFSLLILAGFNVPVSEDLMLFISAMLSVQHDHLFWPLFIAVYLGGYFSDLICYGLGRFFGDKIWKIKFFAKMITQKRLEKIQSYYFKYGGFTLLFGRFIPFGVRNGLFLTAGMGKMKFVRFAMFDFVACSVTVVFYFIMYRTFGQKMFDFVKENNIYVFIAAIVVVLTLVVLNKRKVN